MIDDQTEKDEIAEQWATVKRLCKGGHASIHRGGVFVIVPPSEGFRNLPLVLGYSVLDQVLYLLIKTESVYL